MAGAVVLLSKYGRGESAIFDADGNLDISSIPSGGHLSIGGVRFYNFTTAITENSTATTAPVGSFGFTSNATGRNKIFRSDGSVWQAASGAETGVQYAEVSIASAAITGTSAGQLGHADGVTLVAAPGAGKAIEFLSAVVINDFATAAYTGGGNVSVNYAAGGAVSGVVSAANSIGAVGDKVAVVLAAVPANNQLLSNTGLNLVAASAFTQPGTAAGVVRVKVAYRVHTTGL